VGSLSLEDFSLTRLEGLKLFPSFEQLIARLNRPRSQVKFFDDKERRAAREELQVLGSQKAKLDKNDKSLNYEKINARLPQKYFDLLTLPLSLSRIDTHSLSLSLSRAHTHTRALCVR